LVGGVKTVSGGRQHPLWEGWIIFESIINSVLTEKNKKNHTKTIYAYTVMAVEIELSRARARTNLASIRYANSDADSIGHRGTCPLPPNFYKWLGTAARRLEELLTKN